MTNNYLRRREQGRGRGCCFHQIRSFLRVFFRDGRLEKNTEPTLESKVFISYHWQMFWRGGKAV